MNTSSALILSLALLAFPAFSNSPVPTKEPDRAELTNADMQKLARDAVESATVRDSKTRKPPRLKIRLKNGSDCTLEVGRDRQTRCIETGQVFNALIVQCDSMPPQLRARCEAAQSTMPSKGR